MAGISRAAFMNKMASGHVVASGDCDHLTYIRLILSLVEHEMSGTFQLSFQRRSRTLYVLGGRPVAYKSDLPGEQLNKSLAAAGVVNRSQLQWIEERLGAGESLEAALLQSGAIDEKALADHARYQIRQGLSSAVQWRASKWRFESCATPLAKNVDPAFFLDLPINLKGNEIFS